MEIGATKINVKPNHTIYIDSDTRLVLYGIKSGKRHSILASGTKFHAQTGEYTKLEAWTTDAAFWTHKEVKNIKGNPVDSVPMELHVEEKPPSLRDEMREYIREILSTQANMEGDETFEESIDFDIEDEFDPTSPYELQDMVTEYEDLPTEPPQEPLGEPLDESDTNMAVEVKNAVQDNTEPPEANP